MTMTSSSILPVMQNFDAFVQRIGSNQLVIFLDYDGTLTPIVSRPEDALIPPKTKESIQHISQKYVTAVVSGRAMQNVHALVGVDNLIYAGSHGFNIEGPQLRYQVATEYIPTLTKIAEELQSKLGHIPGFIMENNQFSLSAHYRMVQTPEDKQRIERVVKETVAKPEYSDKARVTNGSMVFEIRPKFEWHKGKAVEFLIDFFAERGIISKENSFSIFIGDDRTDEDAFRSLRDNGLGAGILVADPSDPRLVNGNETTAAEFSIANTELVRDFLERIAGADINTTKYPLSDSQRGTTASSVSEQKVPLQPETTLHSNEVSV